MIQPVTHIHGVAAPIDRVNIDTDAIIPARFMKTVKRSGLGVHLFDGWRYGPGGVERPEFVLNQPAFRPAQILVANDNFGCGSSREHAVWALVDFGIRCVIAPGFAEIFYGNAIKNGLLPVVLPQHDVRDLFDLLDSHPGSELTVDLNGQCVTRPDGKTRQFAIDPSEKRRLLLGLDNIAMTLEQESSIARYEIEHKKLTPWLFKDI